LAARTAARTPPSPPTAAAAAAFVSVSAAVSVPATEEQRLLPLLLAGNGDSRWLLISASLSGSLAVSVSLHVEDM
jgi:hypothetical protein